MSPDAKGLHARRMRIHSEAMRTLVDDARDRVVLARARYLAVPEDDVRAMVVAQCRLVDALNDYFDAAERAMGRR